VVHELRLEQQLPRLCSSKRCRQQGNRAGVWWLSQMPPRVLAQRGHVARHSDTQPAHGSKAVVWGNMVVQMGIAETEWYLEQCPHLTLVTKVGVWHVR
jgi:hypothetical protein